MKSERKTKKTKENQEKTKKTEKSPLKNSFESGKIKCSKSGQSSCALTGYNTRMFECPNLASTEGFRPVYPEFKNKIVNLSYAENIQVGGKPASVDPSNPPHKYPRMRKPTITVGWLDCSCMGTWNIARWNTLPDASLTARYRHLGKLNLLFVDGHVNNFGFADTISDSTKYIWSPGI